MASGVPIDAFAREIGMTTENLLWLTRKSSRKLEGEPTRVWELVMRLLTRKLGEIMNVRIEIERRETAARRRKVAAQAQERRRGHR